MFKEIKHKLEFVITQIVWSCLLFEQLSPNTIEKDKNNDPLVKLVQVYKENLRENVLVPIGIRFVLGSSYFVLRQPAKP